VLIGGSPTSSIKEIRDVVNGCSAIQPIECMENVISKAKMIANKTKEIVEIQQMKPKTHQN
jgi:hypothetical protein